MFRMYVYEVEDHEASWAELPKVRPDHPYLGPLARRACALTEWAGLGKPWSFEEVRYAFLPPSRNNVLFYTYAPETSEDVRAVVVVSTVPLSWLPEAARRGVFSQTAGGAR